jgi:hypothetical protein
MKVILLFFFVFSLAGQAQDYAIHSVTSNVNGDPGPMTGVPGDNFMCTVTFTNNSDSVICLSMNRYKKTIPPYWYSCYCYIQCYEAITDTILVYIQPRSSEAVSLSFKTDSVNPGIATSGFRIFQYGYNDIVQTITMLAVTVGNTQGIDELNQGRGDVVLFPNPSAGMLQVSATGGRISELKILDHSGKLLTHLSGLDDERLMLNTADYPRGLYIIEVSTREQVFRKRFMRD